jgi:hypothetical protein
VVPLIVEFSPTDQTSFGPTAVIALSAVSTVTAGSVGVGVIFQETPS